MKKGLILTAVVAFAMIAGTAFAGSVVTSKHNLGVTGTSSYRTAATSEICVFCHTPHNARLNVPLWSRSVQVSAYLVYTASATLTTITGGADSVTGIDSTHISFRCLGCHDGTIAPTTIARGRWKGANAQVGASAFGLAAANLGTDLTNDHPVGFSYGAAAQEDTDLAAETGGKAGGELQLFNAGANTLQIECATCHDVHNAAGNTYFLRRNNASSMLCRTCHQK